MERNQRPYVKRKDHRLQWTEELHQSFLIAIDKIGGLEKATPKPIVHVMNVDGLTISHVKSHLQMYRGAMNHTNKKEGRKQSSKNNGGNSDQQHDESLHPSSNLINGGQFQYTSSLKRLRMEQYPISNALECNKRVKGGGLQLKDSEEESNTSKENTSDDNDLMPTSILISEEMEERQDA